jgi:CheY-like chemotaxis protein
VRPPAERHHDHAPTSDHAGHDRRVLRDLGLPDGGGLDVIRGLLARRPVFGIALSGYGAESDVRSTREAGFQRHLVKPVEVSQLIEAIEMLLARDRSAVGE